MSALVNYVAVSLNEPITKDKCFAGDLLSEKIKDKKGVCFHNFYDFEPRDQFNDYKGLLYPAMGQIVVDFDGAPIELNAVWEQVRVFVELLRKLAVPELTHFSGRKGFHVCIPASCLNLKSPLPENIMQPIVRSFLSRLKTQFSFVDTAIYNSTRKIRGPNSRHDKTCEITKQYLHKYCLNQHFGDDFFAVSVSEIREAATLRQKDLDEYIAHQGACDVDLTKHFNVVPIAPKSHKPGKALGFMPPCIRRMIEDPISPGERHEVGKALMQHFKSEGMSLKDAESEMLSWAKRVFADDPGRVEDYLRQVGHWYQHEYSVGCYSEGISAVRYNRCSAKCKVYKTLDPARRAKVEDANKTQQKENEHGEKARDATQKEWMDFIHTLLPNAYFDRIWEQGLYYHEGVEEDDGFVSILNNVEALRAKLVDYKAQNKLIKFSRDVFKDMLMLYVSSLPRRLRKNVEPLDVYNGPDVIADFCSGLKATNYTQHEIVLIFKRWMSGVLRRYYDCKFQNYMIILKGAQNLGKDTFTAQLTKCFAPYAAEFIYNQHQARDAWATISKNLVLICPEWDKFKKFDAEMKALITAQKGFARLAYRRDEQTLNARASFIGSSNKGTVLTDDTGNRRFIVIDVEKIDWSFDFNSFGGEQGFCDAMLQQTRFLAHNKFEMPEGLKNKISADTNDKTPQSRDAAALEVFEEHLLNLFQRAEYKHSDKIPRAHCVEMLSEVARLNSISVNTLRNIVNQAKDSTGKPKYLTKNHEGQRFYLRNFEIKEKA